MCLGDAARGGACISCPDCPLHHLARELYCRTCRQAVCSACATGEFHEGHPTCPIHAVIDADLAALGAAVKMVDNAKIGLQEALGGGPYARREAVEAEVARVELAIRAHFQQLREKADLRERLLLVELATYRGRMLDDMTKSAESYFETLAAVEGSVGGKALLKGVATNSARLVEDSAEIVAVLEAERRALEELEMDVVDESISFCVDDDNCHSDAHRQGGERLCVKASVKSAELRKVLFGGSCSSLHHMPLRNHASRETLLAGHAGTVTGCVVSSDVRLAVSTSQDGSAKVWDLVDGKLQSTYVGHSDSVTCVVLTRDDSRAITGSKDNTIQMWDLDCAQTVREFDGHVDWVYSLAISQDGEMLVSASADRTLRVWDVEVGETVQLLIGHDGAVTCCAITADGSRVVSGSRDKTTRVWDTLTGEIAAVFNGHSDWVLCCALLNGSLMATGSADASIKLWNIDTIREMATLTGHRNWVTTLSVTHDGKRLVSGSEDKTLKLWDLEDMALHDSIPIKSVPRALAMPAANPQEQVRSILATQAVRGFIWPKLSLRKMRSMTSSTTPSLRSSHSCNASRLGSPRVTPQSRSRVLSEQGDATSRTSWLTLSSRASSCSDISAHHGPNLPRMLADLRPEYAAHCSDSSGFGGKLRHLGRSKAARSLRIGVTVGAIGSPTAASPPRKKFRFGSSRKLSASLQG